MWKWLKGCARMMLLKLSLTALRLQKKVKQKSLSANCPALNSSR